MTYHKYDPQTKIYIESVEADAEPSNSVSGKLPDLTTYYTVAYINNEWVSVLRPECQVVDNKIELLPGFQLDGEKIVAIPEQE